MASVNQKVRSGNHILVLLDGVRVGLMQSVSMQDDYSPEPASGIGDIHAEEYVPTMARHSLNVTAMVLRKNSLLELGIIPENGDAMLRGLVFDIVSADKETGAILRTYHGCSYASGGLEINKHSILMQSGMFNALNVTGFGA